MAKPAQNNVQMMFNEEGKSMWYVIWVESGKEHKVRGIIESQVSAETYERIVIPEKRIQKKFRGEWKEVQSVLFPGYLFVVAEDIAEFAAALNAVPEFTKMLKMDYEIAAIYPEEEAMLTRLVDQDEVVKMSEGIIENDRVVIFDGPLQGMEGTIKRINRHKRIAVLQMELFERVMQVEVGLEIVEKT